MALMLAPLAALAAVQASSSWRRTPARRPIDGAAALGAAAIGFGALGGVAGIATAAALSALVAGALWLAVLFRHRAGQVSDRRSLPRTLAVAAAYGAACAGPVVLRADTSHGAVPVLVLCVYALAFDAAAAIAASEGRWWEGPLGGIAALVPATIVVAAVLVPPFRGSSPWVLGVAAAVLAPLGPLVAAHLVADDAVTDAVRRIGSLVVLGPAWAALALALVG